MNSFSKQKITGLGLTDNWQGLAVEKWSDFAFKPDRLLENPDLIFKSDADNITVLKQVESSSRKVQLVVKKTVSRGRLKNLALFFRPPKAVRNLHIAAELKAKEIDVAEPVAALWHKRGLQRLENIYIAEFCQGSLSLYDVASGRDKEILSNFGIRKAVIRQVAELIAKLHKADFWHRDSKAGNFIVHKNEEGNYRVKLVDLDGIKLNFFSKRKNRIRTLSKLAETLMRFKAVNFTDLYRGFLFYCEAMAIDNTESKKLLREIERFTVAARLLTIVSDSYDLKENERTD